MPIVDHYACVQPPDDTVICRFMEFWKFRDLFANEELYFTRTDLFKDDDPWEALPSDEYVRKALGLRLRRNVARWGSLGHRAPTNQPKKFINSARTHRSAGEREREVPNDHDH